MTPPDTGHSKDIQTTSGIAGDIRTSLRHDSAHKHVAGTALYVDDIATPEADMFEFTVRRATVADVPAIREARKGAFDVVNTRSKAMFLEAQVRARIDMFTASAAR